LTQNGLLTPRHSLLQWGHPLLRMEIKILDFYRGIGGVASMGPSSFEDGNPLLRQRRPSWTSRFNGAILF